MPHTPLLDCSKTSLIMTLKNFSRKDPLTSGVYTAAKTAKCFDLRTHIGPKRTGDDGGCIEITGRNDTRKQARFFVIVDWMQADVTHSPAEMYVCPTFGRLFPSFFPGVRAPERCRIVSCSFYDPLWERMGGCFKLGFAPGRENAPCHERGYKMHPPRGFVNRYRWLTHKEKRSNFELFLCNNFVFDHTQTISVRLNCICSRFDILFGR